MTDPITRPVLLPAIHPYCGGNGVLDVVGQDGLPFQVRRAFRIALVPPGAERAGHAHRTCSQILWSVAGKWHVRVETRPGATVLTFEIEEGREALMVPPGNWLTLTSSTKNDVMVVLCSEPYYEESYVRDRAEWMKAVGRSLGRE